MNVNQVAFCTSSALAIATGVAVFAAATTAATVATVAYTILAIGLGGASIASVTAWLDPKSDSVEAYFNTIPEHAGVAVAGLYQFTAQVLVQALIKGLADGIGKAITRKIAGDDLTVKIS